MNNLGIHLRLIGVAASWGATWSWAAAIRAPADAPPDGIAVWIDLERYGVFAHKPTGC